jgi:hypothetical protein
MRRIINMFKEPIYKDDLLKVLKYGFINMLLFSIFAGAIQFFFNIYLGIGVGILIYLIAYMMGKSVKDNIFGYHILYPLILTIMFLIGIIIYNITLCSFLAHNISFGFEYVLSWGGLSYIVFPYFNFKTYLGIDILYNIIDILILIFSISTIWRFLEMRK